MKADDRELPDGHKKATSNEVTRGLEIKILDLLRSKRLALLFHKVAGPSNTKELAESLNRKKELLRSDPVVYRQELEASNKFKEQHYGQTEVMRRTVQEKKGQGFERWQLESVEEYEKDLKLIEQLKREGKSLFSYALKQIDVLSKLTEQLRQERHKLKEEQLKHHGELLSQEEKNKRREGAGDFGANWPSAYVSDLARLDMSSEAKRHKNLSEIDGDNTDDDQADENEEKYFTHFRKSHSRR